MANDYKFISTETDEIVSSMVAAYEQLVGRTVKPASPERLFITWAADAIVQTRELINYTGNQNIPSRASGENLDALAELFFQKTRPEATAAQCTVRFTISAVQTSTIIIPAGTRVTDPDRTLIWKTTENVQIPIGSLSADVAVECQTVGTVGNGWSAGQITELVDVFPYYSSCTNITASDGGSEIANDAEFYAMLRNSEDAYSTAGAVGGYEYWAKTASNELQDVLVIRPVETIEQSVTVYDHHAFIGGTYLKENTLVVKSGNTTLTEDTDYSVDYTDGLLKITLLSGGSAYSAESLSVSIESILAGDVWIYGLMDDGTAPGAEIKSRILSICNSEEVRPLTDRVSVKDPLAANYNINVTYYMQRNSDLSSAELSAAVQAAVNEYKAWQSGKLGRDINPSKLISLLMETGVKRVVVTSPSFTALADGSDNKPPQLATVGTVTITNGGLEDE